MELDGDDDGTTLHVLNAIEVYPSSNVVKAEVGRCVERGQLRDTGDICNTVNNFF